MERIVYVYKAGKRVSRKETGLVWSDEKKRIHLERMEKVSVQIRTLPNRDHT